MSQISTHVLDTSTGRPAAGVSVTLSILTDGAFVELGRGETDTDGRLKTLLGDRALEAATYKLVFDTGGYFTKAAIDAFYPEASIVFVIREATRHHHVPLLLAPFGYSTYRGS